MRLSISRSPVSRKRHPTASSWKGVLLRRTERFRSPTTEKGGHVDATTAGGSGENSHARVAWDVARRLQIMSLGDLIGALRGS